jgi:hypothetical protein
VNFICVRLFAVGNYYAIECLHLTSCYLQTFILSNIIQYNYITSVFHWNVIIWLVMKWSHDYKRDVSHPNATQIRTCRNWKKMHIIFFIYIFLFRGKRGGGAVHLIYFRSFTHIIGFLINIWWQLILIRSQIITPPFFHEIKICK